MDIKIFATVFITVFIAELSDKTQIATLLYASDKEISLTTKSYCWTGFYNGRDLDYF